MVKLKVGEVVWVRTGLGVHEEPATVLELSCPYQYYYRNYDSSDDETKKENKENKDGILVRYNVSNIEEVVYFKNVRSLLDDREDDDTTAEGGGDSNQNRRRRSSRTKNNNNSNNTTRRTSVSNSELGGGALVRTKLDDNTSTAVEKKVIEKPIKVKVEKGIANKNEDDDDDDDVTLSKMKSKKTSKKRKSETKIQVPSSALLEEDESIPSTALKKKRRIEVKVGDIERSNTSPYFNQNATVSSSESTKNKKSKTNNKESSTNTSNIKSTKSKIKKEENSSESLAGKPDGYGGLIDPDSIYTVEYSPTARATCKRCDQRIAKGEIRIGHRPLFRGKPGFRVYKHLHCIIFSLDVESGNDVDGYYDLIMDDRDAVDKRIKESAIEVHEDNKALDPDELVQKAFDGPIRDKPKGLVANLLPFQTEGVSWMYCQEVNVPDIRGGRFFTNFKLISLTLFSTIWITDS